jgi:adenosylhomocysteine nucleosidase
MILIVAALKAELLPLIQYFRIEQKELVAQGTLYHSEKLHLLRTGVGMQKAGETLSTYLKKYQPGKIINIGTAGALNPKFGTGKIIEAKCIKNEQVDEIYLIPLQINQQLFEQVNLLTVTEAVLDRQRKEKLSTEYNVDIVDMEAFALANIAQQNNIEFYCIKIISDQADENAKKDFENNYKNLIDKLSEQIVNFLKSNL